MKNITSHLAAILFLGAANLAFAQSTAFTYQGRLNDGPSPASGIYDLRFTIYDAASAGSVVAGPVTNSPTAISNGLFAVTLDFGAGVFNGAGRWLEVAARTNGSGAFTTLSPRPQLTSTPYAIQSANAARADFATTANFANNAAEANIANLAKNADSANDAANANHAHIADVAEFAGRADTANAANTANTANTANFANSVPAVGILGPINPGQLSAPVVINGTSGWTLAGTFSGNGLGLSTLNASALSSGTVADARLSTSVALRSGGNTFSGNQVITNGSVGIATTSPGKMLQLGGPANTEAMIRMNSTAADGVAGRAWDVGVPKSDTSTAGKFFSFAIQDTASSLPAFLARWDTGYIGLYNTNPIALLTVGNAGSPAYCNGTTWVNGSDRNAKEKFAPVDGADVLARVVSLPVQSWSYKAQPGEKHIGPMAQDFHAAFGLNGSDDKHIATVDEGGVALAAIQGLNQKLEATRAENAQLKSRLEKLEQLLNANLNGGAK